MRLRWWSLRFVHSQQDAQPYLGARSEPLGMLLLGAGYMMVDGVFPLEALATRPLGL